MVGHEEFIKAIQQEPENDLPRAVYADWLEDRGDIRGEYLRLSLNTVSDTLELDHYLELAKEIDFQWRCAVGKQFHLVLLSFGDSKIMAIKTVRALTGYGLKEAKNLVDRCPSVILTTLREEAEQGRREFRDTFNSDAHAVVVAVGTPPEDWPTSLPVVSETVAHLDGFNLVLSDYGSSKLGVIKDIRHLTGLGLKEAKELVESCPCVIRSFSNRTAAEQAVRQLQQNPGTVARICHAGDSII